MLLLTSTSDIIRVVTGSAADVDVHASWLDNTSGTITAGRTNTAAITTATTTTVVGSPASGAQRNVKHLNITNSHASVSTTVLVQHFDGTTSEDLMGVTLLPGENLIFTAEGEWTHHDVQGAEYAYSAPAGVTLGVTGTIGETIPRELCPEVNTSALTSGTLFLQAINLVAGQLVSSITFWSATTAAASPTNQLFGLYDVNRNLLATSSNGTTGAWAANSAKTLTLTTPYRIQTSGQYYLGIMVAAGTVPTLKGGTAKTGGQLASAAPALHGNSSTGLTTSLPNPAAAITGSTTNIYGSVS